MSIIEVTRPFLPPKEEYKEFLDGIWERNWLTNHGPVSKEFESRIKDRFNLTNFNLVTNGTIALQLAFKALDLKGEVITTPFTYIATTSALIWEGLTPVFADIDGETLNIDVDCIESLITNETSAILATHVYGNPCDIERLEALCKKYSLKLIFDAAHAFDSTYNDESVFKFGDVSTVSFHATKLFHTIEGGGVFCKDDKVADRISFLMNFGHFGETEFKEVGINGKTSEFNAAMGLVNFRYIDSILVKRKSDYHLYKSLINSSKIRFPEVKFGNSNYAYVPILFDSEENLVTCREALKQEGFGSRRYFNPSLNTLWFTNTQKCPVSENVSKRVLCLPTYYDLESNDIISICKIINQVLKG